MVLVALDLDGTALDSAGCHKVLQKQFARELKVKSTYSPFVLDVRFQECCLRLKQ